MNFFNRFRKNESAAPQAHMTWAKTSVGRTFTRTGLFLKKQLWIWPVIAVVILSTVGILLRHAIENTMRENLKSELQTLLTAETSMLVKFLNVQRSIAETAANDIRLREAVIGLINEEEGTDIQAPVEPAEQASPNEPTPETSEESPPSTPQSSEAEGPDNNLGNKTESKDADTHLKSVIRELARQLGPLMASHEYIGYFITDRDKRILASSHPMLVGQQEITKYDGFLDQALDGESTVSPPFPSVVMLEDEDGQLSAGHPTMYVCAPIRDETFQVIGALALQMRPEDEFTDILQLGQLGQSGETYAFNRDGRMISNSRFDDDLVLLGILPDIEHARSVLNVLVHDPQGDMTAGYRPTVRRSEMPLTRMAAAAVAGESGVDVNGYRDYRGVPVVGAWTWLPKYDIGVATEIDFAEAFRPLTILRRAFWFLYALLVASAVAIFAFTVVVARVQREARKAAIEAQQLGQYTLEHKLGSGAMGVVYRGRHAMMQRPTAIKLLDEDKVNDGSIERFEREVQITCRLNHPSTIAIYDFGRTPEGVFYYAMEYLDGIDLQQLVDQYGPQHPGRVINILLQICGSLYEAHSQGLVHRDIKPANVMINHRGGEPDAIKVLDFGLVKAIDDEKQAGLSRGDGLTGTPLYMSPEAIQAPLTVDGRSDLYSVGAVGYFLLTGQPVFEASSLVDLCHKHVDEMPDAPSKRTGQSFSPELEYALLSCLEKSRAKRPQTARDLAVLLNKCPERGTWTLEDADAWWSRHERGTAPANIPSKAQPTSSSALDQTLVYKKPD